MSESLVKLLEFAVNPYYDNTFFSPKERHVMIFRFSALAMQINFW